MVGPNGTVADYCFCWNDKHFREYVLEEIREYARLKPYCVWMDDDLRANNHAPVNFGCFCDDCIARFNRIPAILETGAQALLLPREDYSGKVTSVSVANLTVGESGRLQHRIRRPASAAFHFVSPREECTLNFKRDGEDYIVDVPSVAAWDIGIVTVKR